MSTIVSHLDQLLDPIADCLTPEVARRIAGMRADEQTQTRINELAAKANEGTLTTEERADYLGYVEAIDLISILQAKARLVVNRSAPDTQ
jgi:hypothetical protein